MRIKVKVPMTTLLRKAKEEAEAECGFEFTDEFAINVLRYSIRKLKRIGQTEDYLPLLYRTELVQHIQMMSISNSNSAKKGESLCVCIA